MNSLFKLLDRDSVKEAWCDIMEDLVVENLKEHYMMCLDWGDIENATAILTVIRYFSSYTDFKQFLDEVADAGYSVRANRNL